jgi:hypothetical protein
MKTRSHVVGLGIALASLAGCNATDSLTCGPADFDAEAGVVGDFGSDMNAAKVEAFLHASSSLVIEVADVETRLRGACAAIATDLGVAAGDVSGADVAAACHLAAEKIRTTIETNVPSQATLSLAVTPTVCGVSVDAYADCVAKCEVTASGSVDVTCTGGTLYGECSGSCSGTCSGSCSAGCMGSCAATCTGTCSGNCFGTCNGTCSQTNAAGECVGQCTGTCTGTCAGQCTGSCSGSCDGLCEGSCEGECHGSCSVEFVEPRCDGQVEAQASAECQSACDADVSFNVDCQPGEVTVELAADVTPAQRAQLDALFATLHTNLPTILEVSVAGAGRLKTASEAFVASRRGVGEVVVAGATAAACTVRALDAAIAASARIDVNVMASFEVNGALSAQGMAGAP